jgi:hypothetical protein
MKADAPEDTRPSRTTRTEPSPLALILARYAVLNPVAEMPPPDDSPHSLADVAATPPSPPIPHSVPPELEALLGSIQAEVCRVTDVSRLRAAAGNLLDDCRDIAREGNVETAVALARHLSRSIPEYFGASKQCRADAPGE